MDLGINTQWSGIIATISLLSSQNKMFVDWKTHKDDRLMA